MQEGTATVGGIFIRTSRAAGTLTGGPRTIHVVKRPRKPPKYVIVQGCVVPRLLAPFLRQLLDESHAGLVSCWRGADAEPLLHHLGKHSQQELWDCFQAHRPGCNPANPPGLSTHEGFNDGAAYSQWRRGQRIPWWATGIDIDPSKVPAFIAAAKRHGWVVARTYPSSTREAQHVNFRKPPVRKRAKARLRALLPIAHHDGERRRVGAAQLAAA